MSLLVLKASPNIILKNLRNALTNSNLLMQVSNHKQNIYTLVKRQINRIGNKPKRSSSLKSFLPIRWVKRVTLSSPLKKVNTRDHYIQNIDSYYYTIIITAY
jgi:hypothetical protein